MREKQGTCFEMQRLRVQLAAIPHCFLLSVFVPFPSPLPLSFTHLEPSLKHAAPALFIAAALFLTAIGEGAALDMRSADSAASSNLARASA